MPLNTAQVGKDIVEALKSIAGKNAGKLNSFAIEQKRLLLEAALALTQAVTEGSIKYGSARYKFFEKTIAEQTKDFAIAVATLIAVAVQEAYDAISAILWDSIRGAIGLSKIATPALP